MSDGARINVLRGLHQVRERAPCRGLWMRVESLLSVVRVTRLDPTAPTSAAGGLALVQLGAWERKRR